MFMSIEDIKKSIQELFSLQNQFQIKAMDQVNWWEVEEMNGKPVNYAIATLAEMAEAMESLDFKWWGPGKDDLVNFSVELIDILHFEMSNAMRAMALRFDGFTVEQFLEDDNPILNGLVKKIYDSQETAVSNELDKDNFYDLLLQLVGISSSLSSKRLLHTPILAETYVVNVRIVFDMIKLLGMSFPEICERYKLKNALNVVRKMNGYKTGTYVKTWVSLSTGIEDEDNKIALELIRNKNLEFNDLIKTLDNYYKTNIMALAE